MLFEVGRSGDGKGMESILDKNVLGEKNCASIECGAFTDMNEFRRPAHFGWNKLNVRIQEFIKERCIVADVWKRFMTGEEIDIRANYDFTVKRSFGPSFKVQEVNFESIPVIEDGSRDMDNNQFCNQIKRRVLCAKVDKATFVHNEEDVDVENGKFMYIAQDELSEFLF